MTDTRLRVKVFTRGQDRLWEDRGIGHVSSGCVEGLRGMSLLVRAESDDVDKIVGAPLGRKEKSTMISGSLLLESKINPNTNYWKGQYTILWCEAENYDLALSFQENAGCDEFWEKICQVLGRDPWEEDAHFLEEELEEEECSGDLSSLVPFALTPEF